MYCFHPKVKLRTAGQYLLVSRISETPSPLTVFICPTGQLPASDPRMMRQHKPTSTFLPYCSFFFLPYSFNFDVVFLRRPPPILLVSTIHSMFCWFLQRDMKEESYLQINFLSFTSQLLKNLSAMVFVAPFGAAWVCFSVVLLSSKKKKSCSLENPECPSLKENIHKS